jgi:hypothetical protein
MKPRRTLKDWVSLGFAAVVYGDANTPPEGRGPAAVYYRRQFERGQRLADVVIREIGGPSRLQRVLARSEVLRELAQGYFRCLVGGDETAVRREPCAICRHIAICAATSRTCGVFRSYTHGNREPVGTTVPDRSWRGSFFESLKRGPRPRWGLAGAAA